MVIRPLSLAFVALAAVLLSLTGSGCTRTRMTAQGSNPDSVRAAAEAVLKERYYQVKVKGPEHIQALTPIEVVGNEPTRKLIDVYVLRENGFFMPKVSVRNYLDVSEPPQEKAGPITRRFPAEVSHESPYPAEDWQAVVYDRNLENEIRNAILARMQIPS